MKDLKNNTQFLVKQGKRIKISDFSSKADLGFDLDELKNELEKNIDKNSKLQEKLYASGKHSLLIVFQAMDAAGKDSTIEHVTSGINPQGVRVNSFKQPSKEELSHDYLWRCYKKLPKRGMIGIFNRSHYEEVLVTRVHPEYILGQNIPGLDTIEQVNDSFWDSRFESIRNFEKHIYQNGTTVIKFFLNVSREEQKNRFLSRINETDKNWKFSYGDVKERKLWDKYMNAYGDMISNTSTKEAPWYIIPADDKPSMRLLVSEIIKETLNDLDLEFPELGDDSMSDLERGKSELEAE